MDSLFFDGEFKVKVVPEKRSYYTTIYGYGLDSLQIKVKTLDPIIPVKLYVNMEYSELPVEKTPPFGKTWNDPNTVVSHVLSGK